MEFNKEKWKEKLEEKLLERFSVSLKEASSFEVYRALGETVISFIARDWYETKEKYSKTKQAFYLSSEFLMGRALGNNLINLGIDKEVREFLEEIGIDYNQVEDEEEDPALGNGGLGRLAACFMDSLATLNLPGQGYSIRYRNGIFNQYLRDGYQVEKPETWLKYGDVWSIMRPEDEVIVNFGNGSVRALPYDMPIIGYGTKNVNTLRLWEAHSINDLDLGVFNQQDYLHATQDKTLAEDISRVLYPNDSTDEGKKLRLRQQYFFVSASLQDIVKNFKKVHGREFTKIPEFIAIQLNDTHPVIAIPELMRILVDIEGVLWEDAWEIVKKTFSYTNHTILAEALEKWPLEFLEEVVPHLVTIIKKLDAVIRSKYEGEDIQIIDKYDRVHMANMDIHFSNSVNGVAYLHTEILKNSELKHFYELYPEKFNNKTNGITFRRWLEFSNRPLAAYLKELIGDEYLTDATKLEKLLAFVDSKEVAAKLEEIKHKNKLILKEYLKETQGIELDENSIIDTQIKRFHEYKRQQMNALYVIKKYLDIKNGKLPKRKITVFFGGKAAPAYIIAQDIIHLILCLSELINNDPEVNKYLNVYLVENYNVSVAEKLIPATDISEQISLASKEASGTGNMKFMLNGALTLGTLDGANVEIDELVGRENIYIFGKESDEIIKLYETAGYVSKDYYNKDGVKEVVDFIISEDLVKLGNKERLERLYNELLNKDWFMTLIDFEEYYAKKEEMLADYENRELWMKKVIANIAKAGFFSSDRTIAQYNEDIWHLN